MNEWDPNVMPLQCKFVQLPTEHFFTVVPECVQMSSGTGTLPLFVSCYSPRRQGNNAIWPKVGSVPESKMIVMQKRPGACPESVVPVSFSRTDLRWDT